MRKGWLFEAERINPKGQYSTAGVSSPVADEFRERRNTNQIGESLIFLTPKVAAPHRFLMNKPRAATFYPSAELPGACNSRERQSKTSPPQPYPFTLYNRTMVDRELTNYYSCFPGVIPFIRFRIDVARIYLKDKFACTRVLICGNCKSKRIIRCR